MQTQIINNKMNFKYKNITYVLFFDKLQYQYNFCGYDIYMEVKIPDDLSHETFTGELRDWIDCINNKDIILEHFKLILDVFRHYKREDITTHSSLIFTKELKLKTGLGLREVKDVLDVLRCDKINAIYFITRSGYHYKIKENFLDIEYTDDDVLTIINNSYDFFVRTYKINKIKKNLM